MSGALNAADLDDTLRADLRRLIVSLADTKRILGIRYSDWLLGAPSIETGIAASGMTQDEWGHARLLYALLKDFDEDPGPVEHDRDPSAYACCDALDAPADDWADVVAFMAVVDNALTIVLEGLAEGTYEPASGRASKMIAEEGFHGEMAAAWVRRLAAGSVEARQRVAAACAGVLPRTLAWMAPDDEPARRLAEAGILPAAETMLARFTERHGALLAGAGVDMPEPDRSDWDGARGRGPGHPGLEAVERARGDRNRELFVE
ncbi:1,2-phenylacetyl-CoA epoxidase subunit PaaC [Gaopeijia maritima]|uniref:Phenylacetic acid catabolic protein n=1 Tax=Gaopeijia maritima TaxID=3119007 RepID=A0ABU9E4I7_9BACT